MLQSELSDLLIEEDTQRKDSDCYRYCDDQKVPVLPAVSLECGARDQLKAGGADTSGAVDDARDQRYGLLVAFEGRLLAQVSGDNSLDDVAS